MPEADREVLIAHPEDLTPAHEQPPPPPPLGGRTWADAGLCFLVGTPCGFLPALALPFLFGRVGAAVGVAVQGGLVALWWFGGFGLFLLMGTVLQAVFFLALFVRCGEDPSRRLGREHHTRYYVEKDFGTQMLALVRRAQDAVAAVLGSAVDSAGLLDDIANTVQLPRQEWEIAQTCAEMTRVKRRIRSLRNGGARLDEMLEPQWEALRQSAEAVERRVVALEGYAERTAAADAAYREWQVMEELEDIGADVQELLARSVQDELAVAEIGRLAEKTPLTELRRTVEEARQAGLVLAAGEKEPA
ncbi:hypothetical protein ACIBI3_02815 [Actinomadura luteofluorescens]|uniref:hypothetical protein n=1 Tax=Actinomadura luteofluorescens TaxID=46163 RepID=UPI00346AA876